MKIVVDTSVWSLVLRRKETKQSAIAENLKKLIEKGEQIYLLGIILQEILSGIADKRLFKKVSEHLAVFPLIKLERNDYIEAAKLRNYCNQKGVQAGSIDFLIASVCINREVLLFSTDNDFRNIAKFSKLKLIEA